MNRTMTIAIAGGLLVSLGGCQSILEPLGFARSDKTDSEHLATEYAAAQDEYFADRLETGRENLRNGSFAAAMEAFRHASLGQNTRAEALNGLGVAYAGIGRLDLARRYFYQAASLDPQDRRFAANIARLHRELDRVDERIELAKQEEEAKRQSDVRLVARIASEDLARAAQDVRAETELPAMASGPVRVERRPAERRAQVLAGGIRVEAAPSRINRISDREVAIISAPAEEAVAPATYPVRVALGEASAGEE